MQQQPPDPNYWQPTQPQQPSPSSPLSGHSQYLGQPGGPGYPPPSQTPPPGYAPSPYGMPPHMMQPPKKKFPLWGGLLIGMCILLIIGGGIGYFILTRTPDGYLNDSKPDQVTWVRWTESSTGQLFGQMVTTTFSSSTQKLNNVTATLEGARNGEHLSLTLTYMFLRIPVSGTLKGNTLTLEITVAGSSQVLVLRGTSDEEYQHALTTLKGKKPYHELLRQRKTTESTFVNCIHLYLMLQLKENQKHHARLPTA